MKKLLFVSDKFPPDIGGMETHAHEFVQHFKGRAGYELEALSFRPDQTPDALDVPAELRERIMRESGVQHILDRESMVNPKAFLDRLKDRPVDILFFNSLYWVCIWETLKGAHPDMKLIMRSGGNDIQQSKIRGKGATVADRRAYVREQVNSHLDHLVITTGYVRDRFLEIGVDPEIMESFVGGVDAQRFKPPSDEEKAELRKELNLPAEGKIVLCIGRFIPFKGIPYALEAMDKVIKESSEPVYFLLVGGGPLEAQINQMITDRGLNERVIMKKFIPVDGIEKYYAASDLYLQLSTVVEQQEEGGSFPATEQMGRTYIEAQACGLPVVASRVGGIPEVVQHGKAGLLVEDGDSESAANHVLQILSDPDLAKRLSSEGRRRAVEEFDWSVLFGAYEKRMFGIIPKKPIR